MNFNGMNPGMLMALRQQLVSRLQGMPPQQRPGIQPNPYSRPAVIPGNLHALPVIHPGDSMAKPMVPPKPYMPGIFNTPSSGFKIPQMQGEARTQPQGIGNLLTGRM